MRSRLTMFKKGRSGNPSGRSKLDLEMRELARAHTPELIERLMFWARQVKNGRAAVMAINSMLDRGWGKPSQDIHVQGKINHSYAVSAEPLTDEQWALAYARKHDEQSNGNGHLGTTEGPAKITH